MISIPDIIFIFAASWRGRWLRRGATTERSMKDKGRLLLACKFDLDRAQSLMTPLYLFFGLILAILWVISVVAIVKGC